MEYSKRNEIFWIERERDFDNEIWKMIEKYFNKSNYVDKNIIGE